MSKRYRKAKFHGTIDFDDKAVSHLIMELKALEKQHPDEVLMVVREGDGDGSTWWEILGYPIEKKEKKR